MIDNNKKLKIKEEIDKRISNIKCPMCKSENFGIADGYFINSMQDDFNNFFLGGPSIPTIAIICGNCGFVSQHALGVLGLIPQNQKDK